MQVCVKNSNCNRSVDEAVPDLALNSRECRVPVCMNLMVNVQNTRLLWIRSVFTVFTYTNIKIRGINNLSVPYPVMHSLFMMTSQSLFSDYFKDQ